MAKKGNVIKAEDFVKKSGDKMTGELEFGFPRIRVTGFDGANNHLIRYSADDSDKILHFNRKGANDYEFYIYNGGSPRKLLHEGNQPQLRVNNGQLEYYDGGAWKPVAAIARTIETAYFTTTGSSANYWYELLNVSGLGVLFRISSWTSGLDNNLVKVRITLDGVTKEIQPPSVNATRALRDGGSGSKVAEKYQDYILNVRFSSNLKIEIFSPMSGYNIHAVADYGLL